MCDRNQMFQLLPHDFPSANGSEQRRLVKNAPEVDRIILAEQVLSCQPDPNPIFNLLNGRFWSTGADQTTCIFRNLQQPRYTLSLIRTDTLGGRLEAYIGAGKY